MIKKVDVNEDVLKVIEETWDDLAFVSLLDRIDKYALYIENKFIGMYFLAKVLDKTVLTDLYVVKDERNKGYSRVLMEDAIKRCREWKQLPIYLYSTHVNYFEKFGFQKDDFVFTPLEQTYVFRD